MVCFRKASFLLAIITTAACHGNNDGEASPPTQTSDQAVFACRYTDPNFHEEACKDYFGDWTEGDAKADCDSTFTSKDFIATLSANACETEKLVGSCEVNPSPSRKVRHRFYGLKVSEADVAHQKCETELNGTWQAGNTQPGEDISAECKALRDEALTGMVSDDDVLVEPECSDDVCMKQLASDRHWISFTSRHLTPKAGVIFFPGAAIDPALYAPPLRAIARSGYLVALVPVPGGFALSAFDRADDVIAATPSINDWFLAGHSLGGVAILAYAKEKPTSARGLIQWASYGTSDYDLHDRSVPTLSIYGTRDGLSTVQEVESGAAFLPSSTSFVKLEGANHAHFGHLCEMDRDLVADIPRHTQQELVQAATVQFVQRTLSGNPTVQPVFARGADASNAWCQQAQRIVVNPPEGELPTDSIANNLSVDTTTFDQASASLDPSAGKKILVQSLLRQGANPWSLDAPAILEGEVWCKMKSQDAVATSLGITPVGPEQTCAKINEAAVQWALAQVSEEERASYQSSGKRITFLPDVKLDNPMDWLASELEFGPAAGSDSTHELTSTALITGNDTSVPVEKRQAYFCKLWAPTRALLSVLAQH